MGLFSKKVEEKKEPEVLRTPEGMTNSEMLIEMDVPETIGLCFHTDTNEYNLSSTYPIYKAYKKLELENKVLWNAVEELQDFKNKVEKVLKL